MKNKITIQENCRFIQEYQYYILIKLVIIVSNNRMLKTSYNC